MSMTAQKSLTETNAGAILHTSKQTINAKVNKVRVGQRLHKLAGVFRIGLIRSVIDDSQLVLSSTLLNINQLLLDWSNAH